MSIRVRLTVWYVLTLAIALGAVAFALVFIFRTAMERQLDDDLAARAAQVASALNSDEGVLTLQGHDGNEALVVGGEFLGLYDVSGKLIDSSAAPPRSAWEIAVFAAGPATQRSQTLTSGDERLRMLAWPVVQGGRHLGTVVIVRSLAPIDGAVRQLLAVLALTIPLAIAIAALGGYVLAYRALRPVEQLRRAAEDYSANDLSGRLAPARLRDDEFGRLARTLDAMLDRVASAVEQRRRFTGDASHELRTPIATILANASLSLERPRSVDDQRSTIARIESEAARMGRIVEGLLVLARTDAVSALTHADDVHVRAVLDASVRRVAPVAAERGVQVVVRAESAIVVADRESGLERVFDNLLDNALRFAPRGTAIEIDAAARQGTARITVADHGPGIPADERARVFERFHRGPGASGSGAGLGLAIASAILEAGRGRISAAETPGGGATFVVELPLVATHEGGSLSSSADLR